MRFIELFFALSLLFVSFGAPKVYGNIHDFDDITAEEILNIADAQKESWFGMIALDYAVKYPDESASQSELILDYPFRIYTIDNYDILKYQTGSSFSSMLQPTAEWLVPMSRSGKFRFCLSIGYSDGKWQTVGIDLNSLGETMKKNIPSEFMPGKEGRKFVRLYPIYMDFIALTRGEGVKLMPVSSSSVANTFPPDKKDSQGLYSPADIMPNIAHNIRLSFGIYPHIRINGVPYPQDYIYYTDSRQYISLTAELYNIFNSYNADLWVALELNDQWYYLNQSMQWVTTIVPVTQLPLQNIADFSIYSGYLPIGVYKVYCGVDLAQDGIVNEPLFWTMTTITVRE